MERRGSSLVVTMVGGAAAWRNGEGAQRGRAAVAPQPSPWRSLGYPQGQKFLGMWIPHLSGFGAICAAGGGEAKLIEFVLDLQELGRGEEDGHRDALTTVIVSNSHPGPSRPKPSPWSSSPWSEGPQHVCL